MPKLILAIDTVTLAQNLALISSENVLARRTHYSTSNHADSLLKNIDDMFEQQKIERLSLDLITVGIGPGSFTGARVGLSVAKAIALASNSPIVGVSSLLASANPVMTLHEGPVATVFDARRSEVYFAVFEYVENTIQTHVEIQSGSPKDFLNATKAFENLVVVGNATHRGPSLKDELEKRGNKVLSQAWEGPSAVSVALLGRKIFKKNGSAMLAELEPNYVRLSDAELNF